MSKSGSTIYPNNPFLAKRIDDIRINLIKEFDPEKIILFGAYARDDFTPLSTIDILIIANSTLSFIDRIKKAIKVCKGAMPPIEPIIYTPEELTQLENEGEVFLESAYNESIILFDKNDTTAKCC